eukprot:GHVU01195170.1.p1 GENE.GHVU01195170.1~~GHVU01195170.1.p1  ORF type:complete len:497 (-),score=108.14 GHVU01195170.1:1503-2993(-)
MSVCVLCMYVCMCVCVCVHVCVCADPRQTWYCRYPHLRTFRYLRATATWASNLLLVAQQPLTSTSGISQGDCDETIPAAKHTQEVQQEALPPSSPLTPPITTRPTSAAKPTVDASTVDFVDETEEDAGAHLGGGGGGGGTVVNREGRGGNPHRFHPGSGDGGGGGGGAAGVGGGVKRRTAAGRAGIPVVARKMRTEEDDDEEEEEEEEDEEEGEDEGGAVDEEGDDRYTSEDLDLEEDEEEDGGAGRGQREREESGAPLGTMVAPTRSPWDCRESLTEAEFRVIAKELTLERMPAEPLVVYGSSDGPQRLGWGDAWHFTVALGINGLLSLAVALAATVSVSRFLPRWLAKERRDADILVAASHRVNFDHNHTDDGVPMPWTVAAVQVLSPCQGVLLRWGDRSALGGVHIASYGFRIVGYKRRRRWPRRLWTSSSASWRQLLSKRFPVTGRRWSRELGSTMSVCFIPCAPPPTVTGSRGEVLHAPVLEVLYRLSDCP